MRGSVTPRAAAVITFVATVLLFFGAGLGYYWFFWCPVGDIVRGDGYTGIIWRRSCRVSSWRLDPEKIPIIEDRLRSFVENNRALFNADTPLCLSDYLRHYMPVEKDGARSIGIRMYRKGFVSRHQWLNGILVSGGAAIDNWSIRYLPYSGTFTNLYPFPIQEGPQSAEGDAEALSGADAAEGRQSADVTQQIATLKLQLRTGSLRGKPLTLPLGSGVHMEMVWIAPGEFMMGSPTNEADRYRDEVQHKVTITQGFWMGKYEVTQEQWEQVMEYNAARFKGSRRPVENVSWKDCQKFMVAANRMVGEGLRMRLPTEAEWEYACRAGTKTAFHYGDSLSSRMANFNGAPPYGKGESREATVDVGTFKPNPWGLYDMHGNVGEWCEDWYGEYAGGPETDPKGAFSGSNRVVRGASWAYLAMACRSADRFRRESPSARRFDIGFRVVCVPEPQGIIPQSPGQDRQGVEKETVSP